MLEIGGGDAFGIARIKTKGEWHAYGISGA